MVFGLTWIANIEHSCLSITYLVPLIYFSAHICKWSLCLLWSQNFQRALLLQSLRQKVILLFRDEQKLIIWYLIRLQLERFFELLSRLYHWKILYKFGNNYCLVKRELKVWFFSMIIVALSLKAQGGPTILISNGLGNTIFKALHIF